MATIVFDREALAKWYAREHLKSDPGLKAVYDLSEGGPDREIRLIEVNDMIVERDEAALEPIEFGVDRGLETEHSLHVLDITPAQWDLLRRGGSELRLPRGWSLDHCREIGRR
jgi:hypothetical protein